MLNSRGVSEYIEVEYDKCKAAARDVYARITQDGESFSLLKDHDLLRALPGGSIAYVNEGYLKLFQENREIRMYSEGDFVSLFRPWPESMRIVSDFKAILTVFKQDKMRELFSNDVELSMAWTSLCCCRNMLHLQLCGDYAPEVVDIDMVVKNFSKGDIIIEEGADAHEVYEMITGKAEVTMNGRVVGVVQNGEIFGELGYFSNDIRRATVTAVKPCFVRVLEPHAFSALLDSNPQFPRLLLKSMAARIDKLNKQLSGSSD